MSSPSSSSGSLTALLTVQAKPGDGRRAERQQLQFKSIEVAVATPRGGHIDSNSWEIGFSL